MREAFLRMHMYDKNSKQRGPIFIDNTRTSRKVDFLGIYIGIVQSQGFREKNLISPKFLDFSAKIARLFWSL